MADAYGFRHGFEVFTANGRAGVCQAYWGLDGLCFLCTVWGKMSHGGASDN
jgi:hypothetical protein